MGTGCTVSFNPLCHADLVVCDDNMISHFISKIRRRKSLLSPKDICYNWYKTVIATRNYCWLQEDTEIFAWLVHPPFFQHDMGRTYRVAQLIRKILSPRDVFLKSTPLEGRRQFGAPPTSQIAKGETLWGVRPHWNLQEDWMPSVNCYWTSWARTSQRCWQAWTKRVHSGLISSVLRLHGHNGYRRGGRA